MATSDKTIDVVQPQTWPSALRLWVERKSEPLRGSTEYVGDLALGWEYQEEVIGLLSGYKLRAYHCTRLLAHEIDSIRKDGLRLLDQALVARRIADAVSLGLLTAAEASVLEECSALNSNTQAPFREGRVCAILGSELDYGADGVRRLLSTWGGEAMYWSHDRTDTEQALRNLGVPSVVVIAVTPSLKRRDLYAPPLPNLFAGSYLGLSHVGGEVHFKAPVLPEDIEAIWHPGDAFYDRYRCLPRK